MRSEKEIESMADRASDAREQPSKLPGMTYEQGVNAALEWVLETPDLEDPITGS